MRHGDRLYFCFDFKGKSFIFERCGLEQPRPPSGHRSSVLAPTQGLVAGFDFPLPAKTSRSSAATNFCPAPFPCYGVLLPASFISPKIFPLHGFCSPDPSGLFGPTAASLPALDFPLLASRERAGCAVWTRVSVLLCVPTFSRRWLGFGPLVFL
jgi:hypothetical protein